MPRDIFTATTNYSGLQEAIEELLHESDDDLEYDLVTLPPKPSYVTDEEEGDDDELVQNNLPRDVPGRVEVFVRGDQWDSEDDDEPLSTLQSKRRRVQNQEPRWHKCNPSYDPLNSSDAVSQRQESVKNALKNLNPVQIFEKLFDDNVVSMIVDNSHLYAAQNNRHEFRTTPDEIKTFLGILILSGYHHLPREKLYWSLNEDCQISIVSNAMTRNRYMEIKKNLHFCDNSAIEGITDKMFKVRPLANILQDKFLQWGTFHENLSIDESMIKYFGRNPAKQFIRGKPVRFGYKNWMLASSCGYCYVFDVYCGKSAVASKEPLGSRVVTSLLAKLKTDPTDHIAYFDNYFTSHGLLKELRESGYRATGTVREGRTKKCPLISVKDMKKKNRADFDYRFDKNNKILFVRWLDNSVCTMGTNYDTVEPLGKVKRWCSVKRQKVDVGIPHVFQNYNAGMGGVDQADQSISLYRVSIRGKKWWWVLFTYMLDVTISNAWRLHILSSNKEDRMDQLQFRRYLARHYLRQAPKKPRPSASNLPSIQYQSGGHFPLKLKKQLKCTVCHAKARWQCKLCLKTLCIEKGCFESFHTL